MLPPSVDFSGFGKSWVFSRNESDQCQANGKSDTVFQQSVQKMARATCAYPERDHMFQALWQRPLQEAPQYGAGEHEAEVDDSDI